jgi:hypothetical protein
MLLLLYKKELDTWAIVAKLPTHGDNFSWILPKIPLDKVFLYWWA